MATHDLTWGSETMGKKKKSAKKIARGHKIYRKGNGDGARDSTDYPGPRVSRKKKR
jgi:hypothetical protein